MDRGVELVKPGGASVAHAAPVDLGTDVASFFGPLENITVQQTMRGCLQECCGCEAQSEYKVYPGEVQQGSKRDPSVPQIAHLLEESACIIRFCCADMRPFNMPLTFGAPEKKNGPFGPKIVEFKKPWAMPICAKINLEWLAFLPYVGILAGTYNSPCCCALPSIETVDGQTGERLGSSQYLCDRYLAVPKWEVRDPSGAPQYLIRPDTCCGGCCIEIKFCGGRGARSIYVPFYIREPVEPFVKVNGANGEPAMINKVWSGFKKECCSDADNFFVRFPAGASPGTKANLLGANVLVDFSFFETQG